MRQQTLIIELLISMVMDTENSFFVQEHRC